MLAVCDKEFPEIRFTQLMLNRRITVSNHFIANRKFEEQRNKIRKLCFYGFVEFRAKALQNKHRLIRVAQILKRQKLY